MASLAVDGTEEGEGRSGAGSGLPGLSAVLLPLYVHSGRVLSHWPVQHFTDTRRGAGHTPRQWIGSAAPGCRTCKVRATAATPGLLAIGAEEGTTSLPFLFRPLMGALSARVWYAFSFGDVAH